MYSYCFTFLEFGQAITLLSYVTDMGYPLQKYYWVVLGNPNPITEYLDSQN